MNITCVLENHSNQIIEYFLRFLTHDNILMIMMTYLTRTLCPRVLHARPLVPSPRNQCPDLRKEEEEEEEESEECECKVGGE